MSQIGAARYARHVEAGQIGTPVREQSPFGVFSRSGAWPVIRPLFAAGVIGGGMTAMGTASTLALLEAPFTSYATQHRMLARGLSQTIWNTGLTLEVTYDTDFDASRPAVFTQNHVSMLDGMLTAAVMPQPFCGLMNHWHYHVPAYGWIMRLARGIRVYPAASGRSAEMTAQARERKAENISILTFPEGHRTRDGNVHAFRRGAFFMARDAEMPIVPIGVRGMYELNPKGSMVFEPGLVEVYVGAQIEMVGRSDDEVTEIAARVTHLIDTWIREGRWPREDAP